MAKTISNLIKSTKTMKIITTKEYLLLIDEEAEIKKGDYILEKEYIINIFPDYLTDLDECDKIIAYYPLSKEAKELDLPLLPPFENKVSLEVEIDNLINNSLYNDFSFREKAGFRVGYREAQSKQFSLEDIINVMNFIVDLYEAKENYSLKYIKEQGMIKIQSLSTQQLPKEFIISDKFSTFEENIKYGEYKW